jgi:hypothetical protein
MQKMLYGDALFGKNGSHARRGADILSEVAALESPSISMGSPSDAGRARRDGWFFAGGAGLPLHGR